MQRHVLIFRLGLSDSAVLEGVDPDAHCTEVQLTDLTSRLAHGISDTVEQMPKLGFNVTEIAIDLLLVASGVYAADKRINRASEAQDGWAREIDLHIPVGDPDKWSAICPDLQGMLKFLTGDIWRIFFRNRPDAFAVLATEEQLPLAQGEISLFSGGLDSFIGAIDLLAKGRFPLFVSHGWVGNDSKHQGLCLKALRDTYGENRVLQLRSRIGFDEGLIQGVASEQTERSRSFLFFSLAALAASGLDGMTTITVPENALISLNVPLDPLRLGAYSTRTTHPFFVASFNNLLSQLGISARLFNPYRFKTKGEMAAECKNSALLADHIAATTSCSSANKARWKGETPGHCGHCVPCIIRRASILRMNVADPTTYTVADLRAKRLWSNRAEGEDVRSFQIAIRKLNNRLDRARILVQESGPLGHDARELEDFAQVYLRGMQEVGTFLNGVKVVPHA